MRRRKATASILVVVAALVVPLAAPGSGRAAADWYTPYRVGSNYCVGAAVFLDIAEDGDMSTFMFVNTYWQRNGKCTSESRGGAKISAGWFTWWEADFSGGASKDCGDYSSRGSFGNGSSGSSQALFFRQWPKGQYPCYWGDKWTQYSIQMTYNVTVPSGAETNRVLVTPWVRVYRSSSYASSGANCAAQYALLVTKNQTQHLGSINGLTQYFGGQALASSSSSSQQAPLASGSQPSSQQAAC